MTQRQKTDLGNEIRRVREMRPLISIDRLAQEAGIAPNTVASVEQGHGRDNSARKILEALGRLGRPVTIADTAPQSPVAEREASVPDGIQSTGDLIVAILRAAPPEEREQLQSNIWLLVRGRNEELIERLRHTAQ
ncbi:helix-turn-helix domain-containing protein [Terrabacter terrigena]|uniref:HTH cro/C1-type domain-containing protein n=1 Tax=Terrabacter terrigena TaxID=574718 RepID=A0ABW3MYC2_9MICO